MTLGERIKQRRESIGLNMAQLADKVGVTEATVQRWEAGIIHPRHPKLIKLSEVLNVDYNYLMSWGEESDESDTESHILDMSQFSPAKRFVADNLKDLSEADALALQQLLRRVRHEEDGDI